MGGSEQKQQGTQSGSSTTNWGYFQPPTTPAIQKVAGDQFTVDPSMHFGFERQRQQLRSGFQNPMGAAYNPTVEQAMIETGDERLNEEEAVAGQQAATRAQALNYGRDLAVAGMTAPTLVSTGGSYSGQQQGTTQVSQSPWGALASAGATAGSMSL